MRQLPTLALASLAPFAVACGHGKPGDSAATSASATSVSSSAPSSASASPSAVASTTSTTASTTAPDPEATRDQGELFEEASRPLSPFAEARTATFSHAGYRAMLAEVREQIEATFAGVPPDAIALQITRVGEGRAVLVSAMPKQPDAADAPGMLLFLFDAQNRLVWSKDRPLAGLRHVAHASLASGPDGELFVTFFEPVAHALGARRWNPTGGLLADFHLATLERCDSLDALYWPAQGWVIAYDFNGRPRVQRLSENGKLAWGAEGRSLLPSLTVPFASPVSLILDNDESVLGITLAPNANAAPSFVALRLDARGNPQWKAPITLFEGPAGARPSLPKVELTRPRKGLVRATLAAHEVEIESDGEVTVVRR